MLSVSVPLVNVSVVVVACPSSVGNGARLSQRPRWMVARTSGVLVGGGDEGVHGRPSRHAVDLLVGVTGAYLEVGRDELLAVEGCLEVPREVRGQVGVGVDELGGGEHGW